MKKLPLYLLLFSGALQDFGSGFGKRNRTFLDKPCHSVRVVSNDTLLNGIQDKIQVAFFKSFQDSSTVALDKIDLQLEESANASGHQLVQYWRAYTSYYTAISHIKMGRKEESKQAIEKGIELLKKLEKKNSEDYALMAISQGFYLQFKRGMAVVVLSQKSRLNGEKALELDNENIRAYYVLANSDFYTPKQYGGGKKVEGLLLKAIRLDDQKYKNPFMPHWGKAMSYALLVRHYIGEENIEEAKKYVTMGLRKYPEDFSLKALKKKVTENRE